MERIKLADIFQDGMILQREKPIYIWGNGIAGDKLTIQICAGQEIYGCKTGEVLADNSVTAAQEDRTDSSQAAVQGSFLVELPPMQATRGMTIIVRVNEEEKPAVILRNISIGDVYLAGGQSNMEYFLRYEAHFDELRKQSENPDIHMYNVPQIAYEGQQRKLPGYGYWFTKNDPAWRVFSSIGYIFAQYIQPEIGVPVGIIGCNWGGTPASSWIDERYMEKEPLTVFRKEYDAAISGFTDEELKKESDKGWAFEDSYQHQLEWRTMMYGLTLEEQKEWMQQHQNEPAIPMGPYHQWRPFGLYDTMIKKVAPLGIKGVLWYQGESDNEHAAIYDQTFKALTDCWRDTWKDQEIAFFTVQLAPFGQWLECYGTNYPAVRESQERAAKTIPGVYMTSIMDLGMYEDIHPKEKKEIARRMSVLALQHLYGKPVCGENPEMVQAIRKENKLVFWFAHTEAGLCLKGSHLNALKLTQDGKKVEVSDMELQKDKLIITCEGLSKNGIEASFAWCDYCEVNLYNSEGLPVKPFCCTL